MQKASYTSPFAWQALVIRGIARLSIVPVLGRIYTPKYLIKLRNLFNIKKDSLSNFLFIAPLIQGFLLGKTANSRNRETCP